MTRPVTNNYRGYTILTSSKTKDLPFGNTCTQVEPNVWEWETQGFKWQYSTLTHQVNLRLWVNDHWVGIVNVRDHREAGCFAEGFSAGFNTAVAKYTEPQGPFEAKKD